MKDIILKKRVAVPRDLATIVLDGHMPSMDEMPSLAGKVKDWDALLTFLRLMEDARAKPKTRIYYEREAYVSEDGDKRVSFDRNVMVAVDEDPQWQTAMADPQEVWGKKVVLELKFNGRFPDHYRWIVEHFHLTPGGAPKYADGTCALRNIWTDRLVPKAGRIYGPGMTEDIWAMYLRAGSDEERQHISEVLAPKQENPVIRSGRMTKLNFIKAHGYVTWLSPSEHERFYGNLYDLIKNASTDEEAFDVHARNNRIWRTTGFGAPAMADRPYLKGTKIREIISYPEGEAQDELKAVVVAQDSKFGAWSMTRAFELIQPYLTLLQKAFELHMGFKTIGLDVVERFIHGPYTMQILIEFLRTNKRNSRLSNYRLFD
jgi:hypothetical protein